MRFDGTTVIVTGAVRTDVSRSADVKVMIDAAISAFGGLDVLVSYRFALA